MAQQLASMSIDQLIKMRDEVDDLLNEKATALRMQLDSLSRPNGHAARAIPRGAKPKSVVAAKYRHPKTGETWSGRGIMARWMTAEIKAGKKREDFLATKGRKKA